MKKTILLLFIMLTPILAFCQTDESATTMSYFLGIVGGLISICICAGIFYWIFGISGFKKRQEKILDLLQLEFDMKYQLKNKIKSEDENESNLRKLIETQKSQTK